MVRKTTAASASDVSPKTKVNGAIPHEEQKAASAWEKLQAAHEEFMASNDVQHPVRTLMRWLFAGFTGAIGYYATAFVADYLVVMAIAASLPEMLVFAAAVIAIMLSIAAGWYCYGMGKRIFDYVLEADVKTPRFWFTKPEPSTAH